MLACNALSEFAGGEDECVSQEPSTDPARMSEQFLYFKNVLPRETIRLSLGTAPSFFWPPIFLIFFVFYLLFITCTWENYIQL